MSMTCKQCAETFPKGQSFTVFELRRQQVNSVDEQSQITNVFIEDGGVFCSRKCLTDYLKSGDHSGVFGLGSRKL